MARLEGTKKKTGIVKCSPHAPVAIHSGGVTRSIDKTLNLIPKSINERQQIERALTLIFILVMPIFEIHHMDCCRLNTSRECQQPRRR